MRVSDFRCLQSADLEFDPEFTLFSGPNASGKTSVLEAIYVLGRGRSFRTRQLGDLIRAGNRGFLVFGEVDLPERRVGLGVEGSADGLNAKMAGDRVGSLAELAAALPVQIIDPDIHRLIEEGPSYRRRFLDWGVFHVEHTFVRDWRKYQHVLRQRNAALRGGQSRAAVSAWDADLLVLGARLDASRSRYTERLAPEAQRIARRLLGMELGLSYRSGWPRELTFPAALDQSWARDRTLGSTHVGPQRADLSIRLDGLPVKGRISRGQQKLLAASLLMAQIRLFSRQSLSRPTLLLDDPAAELDGDRLISLIREIREDAVQLIVTSLSSEFSALGAPGRRYFADGGRMREP